MVIYSCTGTGVLSSTDRYQPYQGKARGDYRLPGHHPARFSSLRASAFRAAGPIPGPLCPSPGNRITLLLCRCCEELPGDGPPVQTPFPLSKGCAQRSLCSCRQVTRVLMWRWLAVILPVWLVNEGRRTGVRMSEGKMSLSSQVGLVLLGLILIQGCPASAGHLHSAAYQGDTRLVGELLARGADVDENDSSGVAPLHYAALMGHTDVIGILVANGADVNVRSAAEANTPLHLASGSGQYGAAGLLLASGASIDKTNKQMETPLHWAIENGRTEMVALLISRGADIEARDARWVTPLHRAVLSGYDHIVKMLLAQGASTEARDIEAVSPLRSALEQGCIRIARLLRLAGAKIDDEDDLARFIQGQLWLRGYGIEDTDGIVGPNTVSALRTYQRHAGLDENDLLTYALADHLASSGEIGPHLSGESGTVTNIFVSWYELAHEYGWEPGLLWSRAEFVEDGLSGIDNDFRGAMKYSGHVRFGRLEIEGTVWVVPNGWVIAHGSRVVLRPISADTRGEFE